jgi:hypothetical protein
MSEHQIEIGVNASHHVLVKVPILRPWWAFWRRQLWWFSITAGQARTMAVALRQAAEIIDRARKRA